MASSSVTERYARTIFRSSLAEGSLEVVAEEFRALAEIMRRNPQLGAVLADPTLKATEKGALLERTFGDKALDLTHSFFSLLVRKNRVGELLDILESFEKMVNRHEGIVTGTITSASSLDEALLQKIGEKYEGSTGRKHFFVNKVNSTLIGGFTIQIGDSVSDWTLKNKLEILRARMTA